MTHSGDKIETYRQMLKLDRRSRVFTLLAEELCAAGEWEEAAEVCKKGLFFHPDHLRSRVLLGWALMEAGAADQSERIFLKAANDIRKNSAIFKLLSEFAAASGNVENACQYAAIFQAFQAADAAEQGFTIEPHQEETSPPDREISEMDRFKSEAIEELTAPGMDTEVPEYSDELPPAPVPEPPRIEDILARLEQNIAERFTGKEPSPIFSDEDKDMFKKKIVAVLGG
jgi:tetratricopeptide (TPR) repeat protein